MTKLSLRRKKDWGFSLVEVMIALLLSAVVTTAAFKAYVDQHKNYLIQDDITNIQQNARASLDELSRQIRMAGLPASERSGFDPGVEHQPRHYYDYLS